MSGVIPRMAVIRSFDLAVVVLSGSIVALCFHLLQFGVYFVFVGSAML